MGQIQSEQVVYRCKLHWGIFMLPLYSMLPLIAFPMVFLWFISNLTAKMGPLAQRLPAFAWFLCLVPALPVGAMMSLAALIAYLNGEVVLTRDRFSFKAGWPSRARTEILLTQVETISLREPLLGRLAGYGTVAVTGTGGAVFLLRFMPKAEYLHGLLQTMVHSAQTPQVPGRADPSQQLAEMNSRYMPKG